MADEQKSEQPTQQRLKKAREEGNFPASREFISAVQFTGFVTLSVLFGGALMRQVGMLMRMLLAWAFAGDITVPRLMTLLRYEIVPRFVPLMFARESRWSCLSVIGPTGDNQARHFARKTDTRHQTPKSFEEVDVAAGSRTCPIFLQASAVASSSRICGLLRGFSENLGSSFLELPWMGPQPAIARIGSTIETLLWRAVGLFLLVGVCDLLWQRHRYTKQLRMTKHEVKRGIERCSRAART